MGLLRLLSVIFLFSVLCLPAVGNERFVGLCEQSKSSPEIIWLAKVLGTSDCHEMGQELKQFKSSDEFLPYLSLHGPSVINRWKGYRDTSHLSQNSNRPLLIELEAEKALGRLFPDLDLFQGFTNLEHVNLVGRSFESVCGIMKRFPHLKSLTLFIKDFYRPGVDDCLAASGLQGVYLRNDHLSHERVLKPTTTKVLGVEGWRSSFRPLSHLPFLKYLHLDRINSPDAGIEALGNNIYLTHLRLESSQQIQLTSLKHLAHLMDLTIGNPDKTNSLRDMLFIEDLSKLRRIDLSGHQIEDISPLKALKHLEFINLSDNRIDVIPDLSRLRKLRSLNLSLNRISSLEELTGLASVRTLNISRNWIQNFNPLSEMKGLTHLNVSANSPSHELSALPPLPNLRALVVDGLNGKFATKSWAENLKLKKALSHLSSDEINEILAIRETPIPDVNTFQCSIRPSLTSIGSLRKFPALIALSLGSQELNETLDLSPLGDLRYLNLSFNNLPNLPLLPEFLVPALVNLTGVGLTVDHEKTEMFRDLITAPHLSCWMIRASGSQSQSSR